jgi:hypothetical protein
MREDIGEARPPLLNTDHSVSRSIVAQFSDAIQADTANLGL